MLLTLLFFLKVKFRHHLLSSYRSILCLPNNSTPSTLEKKKIKRTDMYIHIVYIHIHMQISIVATEAVIQSSGVSGA